MTQLSKQALLVENNQSFPNNNAGLITPSALRTFNEDMIDSTVNQAVYTADSASFDARIDQFTEPNTGSLLETASFASQTLTFTKGDGSTFGVIIPDVSGSDVSALNQFTASQLDINSGYNTFTQSADSRLDNIELETASLQLQIDSISGSYLTTSSFNQYTESNDQRVSSLELFTASQEIYNSNNDAKWNTLGGQSGSWVDASITGSSITSASVVDATITFTKGDSSTFDLTLDNVVNATYAQNTITTGKNLEGAPIIKGSPLFFTGSGTAGNLVGIYYADAGNPDRMPAGGIAGETIAPGAEGIVLLDGYIGGVDTSQFASGDEVFVGVGGGYTNVPPTGSALIQHLGNVEKSAVNGSGVIQMMGEVRGLPNIQEGYLWVGDSNGVPQAVASSSIQTILPSGIVSSSQQITDLGFVSSSITGSSVVTASLSGNTITFTKGDSSTFGFTIPDVSGSTIDTGSFATTGSNSFVGNQTITGSLEVSETLKSQVYMNPQTLDGFVIPTNNNAMLVGPVAISGSVVVEGNSNLIVLSQITSSGATPLPSGVVSGSSQLTSSYDLRYTLSGSVQPLPSGLLSSSVTDFNTYSASVDSRLNNISVDTSSLATTGSNTFIGDQTITGSLFISSSDVIHILAPSFPGQPAPGGVSITGSVAIEGNFAVGGGGFTIGQANIAKIVGSGGIINGLAIVSNVLIYNDGDINNARTLGVSGSAFVSQSISVGEAVRLSPSDPLPITGSIGALAVSGSSLYFYDGTWRQVSLI